MKYLIILLLLASCKKEESTACGIVTFISLAPQIQPYIKVNYNGVIIKKDIDVFTAIQLNVGDIYCQ